MPPTIFLEILFGGFAVFQRKIIEDQRKWTWVFYLIQFQHKVFLVGERDH